MVMGGHTMSPYESTLYGRVLPLIKTHALDRF